MKQLLLALYMHNGVRDEILDPMTTEDHLRDHGIEIDWHADPNACTYKWNDSTLTVSCHDGATIYGTNMINVKKEGNRIECRSQVDDRLLVEMDDYGRGIKIGGVGSPPMASLDDLNRYANELLEAVAVAKLLYGEKLPKEL